MKLWRRKKGPVYRERVIRLHRAGVDIMHSVVDDSRGTAYVSQDVLRDFDLFHPSVPYLGEGVYEIPAPLLGLHARAAGAVLGPRRKLEGPVNAHIWTTRTSGE